jgi:hypothetical protein
VDRFDDAAAQADRQRSRFKAPPPPPHIEPFSIERLLAQQAMDCKSGRRVPRDRCAIVRAA